MSFHQKLLNIPKSEDCLPGRSTPTSISGIHTFNGNNMIPPFSEEMDSLVVGMGCFGEQKDFFGNWMGYGLQQLDTAAVIHPIRLMKKFAQG